MESSEEPSFIKRSYLAGTCDYLVVVIGFSSTDDGIIASIVIVEINYSFISCALTWEKNKTKIKQSQGNNWKHQVRAFAFHIVSDIIWYILSGHDRQW